MALLQETFPGRVISRRGDINWTSRSWDMISLDFFFVGLRERPCLKVSSLEHLKTNIRQVMAEIPSICVKKMVENYFKIINVFQLRVEVI